MYQGLYYKVHGRYGYYSSVATGSDQCLILPPDGEVSAQYILQNKMRAIVVEVLFHALKRAKSAS